VAQLNWGRVSDPSSRFERLTKESPRLCRGYLTGEKCTTTTTPGHPASIDNLEYYSQFVYVITPKGEHLMLRYLGSTVVYPPTPGRYTAETDEDKVLVMYVSYVNGESGKLKYRIEGIWPQ
jgi:hypothetical protein